MTSPLIGGGPHTRLSCRPSPPISNRLPREQPPLVLPLLKEEDEEDLECGGVETISSSDAGGDSIPLASSTASSAQQANKDSTPGSSPIAWRPPSYATTSPFMPARASKQGSTGHNVAPPRSRSVQEADPCSSHAETCSTERIGRPQLRHQQTFPLPAAHLSSEVSSLKATPIPICPVEDLAETGTSQHSMERRNLKLFVQGDRRSLISTRGNLNVHRLIPYITKVYLNWLYDTFPSIIRLKWHTIFFLVIIIYIIVILLYAVCLRSFDGDFVCTKDVHNLADYYFFVVQTLFTIGYGGKEPLCFATNVGVTIISILGLLQHTALTGIVFAKFTLDSSRDLACAFSTRLFAIPPCEDSFSVLGGVGPDRPTQLHTNSVVADREHVRLCFRFVNVFHRHFFHVSMRLFLIEHHPASEDNWSCPTVQELHYFDTSIPLEFMSLPVEVCAYIPVERLPLLHQADVLKDDNDEDVGIDTGTPGDQSVIGGTLNCPTSTSTVDFSTPFQAGMNEASPASHAPRPTLSRVWSTAATAEAADGGAQESTWSIRLGAYRDGLDSVLHKDDEVREECSEGASDRFIQDCNGGMGSRWLSAEDPRALMRTNDFSQSNAAADATSRSAATFMSNGGGSVSKSKRYLRSRTMSNIGDMGSRFATRRQPVRRGVFGAGLVDSLD
ncbi:hypothetical protein FOL47_000858 [Perkinsus chesapeaki]|uniref:Potassium channel inwardly rectifying transmembrane domain-containing protein n=1 Tax=Perkinsus chesapeaki TaxID=330153 RepID=A0A7J6MMG1_PERCH|nr:hypothetical protein FOL47_000858 [Perkinsus chesapeaki]